MNDRSSRRLSILGGRDPGQYLRMHEGQRGSDRQQHPQMRVVQQRQERTAHQHRDDCCTNAIGITAQRHQLDLNNN